MSYKEEHKEVHIFVPDRCPLKVDLTAGDILTITFTQTVYLWNSDPVEFHPALEIDIYQQGTTWSGIAGPKGEDVMLGWLAFVPGPPISAPVAHPKTAMESIDVRTSHRGMVPCTIHIGSGGPPIDQSTT